MVTVTVARALRLAAADAARAPDAQAPRLFLSQLLPPVQEWGAIGGACRDNRNKSFLKKG